MYGKIFESMFDGTLASNGPWQALVTFQQLIVLANKDGIVDMTPEAISRRTTIPLEIIELGLAELMKPDSQSRTPEENGRRIVLVEDHRNWGWQIVNHAKFQAIRKAEERREYLRNAQAERRERLKAVPSTPVNNVNSVSHEINMSTPVSAYASASAPASARKKGEGTSCDSPTQKRKTGARLPENWVLPKAWGNWAVVEYPHWTPETVRLIAQKFRNYWVAKTGKEATKLDWEATWQNWCTSGITQSEFPPPRPTNIIDIEARNAEAKRLLGFK